MIVLITIFPKCGTSPCFMFPAIKRGPSSQLTRKKGCHHPHPTCYDQPLLDPRWHGKHVKGTKRLRRLRELASSGPLLAQGHHRLIRVVGNSEANQRREHPESRRQLNTRRVWAPRRLVIWRRRLVHTGFLCLEAPRCPTSAFNTFTPRLTARRQFTERRAWAPRRFEAKDSSMHQGLASID